MECKAIFLTPIDVRQEGDVEVYLLFQSPMPLSEKSVELETFIYKHGLNSYFLMMQITMVQTVCVFANNKWEIEAWSRDHTLRMEPLQLMHGQVGDKLRESAPNGQCWWQPMRDEVMNKVNIMASRIKEWA